MSFGLPLISKKQTIEAWNPKAPELGTLGRPHIIVKFLSGATAYQYHASVLKSMREIWTLRTQMNFLKLLLFPADVLTLSPRMLSPPMVVPDKAKFWLSATLHPPCTDYYDKNSNELHRSLVEFKTSVFLTLLCQPGWRRNYGPIVLFMNSISLA